MAQFNLVKQAQGKFSKSKWREGRSLLDKALRKDSLQVQAHYAYTTLFLNKRFEYFSIDSAYLFAQQTQTLWNKLNEREKSKLKKFPIDSALLVKLNTTIDSLAFAAAKEKNTEAAYLHFLNVYRKSPQRRLAIELRDEAAFVDALKQNTHTSFQSFLKKYPKGHRSAEARQRFDKLLFEHETHGNTLVEFKNFVAQNPASPHSNVAIAKIFEMETLEGKPETFEQFIRQYPHTPSAKLAYKILIHLLPESERGNLNDSLRKIYPLNEWLPIHQESGYGFMSSSGAISLSSLPELNTIHFCEPLQTDFILTTKSIVGRNGAIILNGQFESATDVGLGFILAKQTNRNLLIHKSGWEIVVDEIQDAQIIANRFLGIKQHERWALFSLTGTALTEFVFQSIESANQFTLFNRAGKTLLVSNHQLLNFAKGNFQPIVADEIKPMGNRFWLRNGALEQVMDEHLGVIIPYARQTIVYNALGLMISNNNQTRLPEWLSNESIVESVTIAEPWAIIRATGEKPALHHIPTRKIIESQADSIWFDQSLVMVRRGDSTRVRLPNQQTINLSKGDKISVRQSKDAALFILSRDKTKTRVIDANTLKELFRTEFYPEPILHHIFLFESKGKKGLLDNKGKTILPASYDAILYNNGSFTLLKENLFGAFNPTTKKIIKPTYESNLRAVGNNIYIALKKSKWGFLSGDGKPLTNFEYDEVQPWTDSIALVSKAGTQALLGIVSTSLVMDSIQSLHKLETPEDTFLSIFERSGKFGLINKSGKVIMPATHEELIPWVVNNKTILIGLTHLNDDQSQVTFYSRIGKPFNTFRASTALAYKFLCED